MKVNEHLKKKLFNNPSYKTIDEETLYDREKEINDLYNKYGDDITESIIIENDREIIRINDVIQGLKEEIDEIKQLTAKKIKKYEVRLKIAKEANKIELMYEINNDISEIKTNMYGRIQSIQIKINNNKKKISTIIQLIKNKMKKDVVKDVAKDVAKDVVKDVAKELDNEFYIKETEKRCKKGYLQDKKDKTRCNKTNKEVVIKKPSVKEPSIKEPSIKEPSVKEPSIKEPSIKEPSIKEPSIKEPLFYIKGITEKRCKKGYLQDKKNKTRCNRTNIEVIKEPSVKPPSIKEPLFYIKEITEKRCKKGYLQDKKDKTRCNVK
jgi:hypothetical protein